MALKDTMKNLFSLLEGLINDLNKSEKGNKAASQRVRTGSIKLEKVAKKYRKESIAAEKKGTFKKKTTAKVAKKSAKKVAKKKPVKKVVKKKAKKSKK